MNVFAKLGLAALAGVLAVGAAHADVYSRYPAYHEDPRTVRWTFGSARSLDYGRMRVTLGRHRYIRPAYGLYRPGSLWDPYPRRWEPFSLSRGWPGGFADWPDDRYRRYGTYFHGYDYMFWPGSRFPGRDHYRLRTYPRTMWQRDALRPRGARLYPDHATQAAHRGWCRQQYRSYRASDNSFQPYRGPRKRCRSPYGR